MATDADEEFAGADNVLLPASICPTTDPTLSAAQAGLPIELLLGMLPAPAEYGQGCFVCHRTFSNAPATSEVDSPADAADARCDEPEFDIGGPTRVTTEPAADGTAGPTVKRSDEDVVPKWLLKDMGIGNAGAVMPNGQLFRYGHRKVPCCFECNQRMSGALEKPVSAAFRAGRDAVVSQDPRVTFLWLAKIYYGTRFRETGLRTNVADPNSDAMLEHEALVARNEYLRRCLQHRPEQLQFTTPPASIFVFRAGSPKKAGRFDFFVPTMSETSDMVAIRAGAVFVIAVFGDNGFWGQKLGGVRLMQAAMSDLVLHPVQCIELMMWFAAELAGHDSSGCYDMRIAAGDDTLPQSLFAPQFVVERNEAPQELLNQMRVASLFDRVGLKADDDVLRRAADGRLVTTLVNATTDELVQAECFELNCLDVFRRAGWQVDGTPCEACGAT